MMDSQNNPLQHLIVGSSSLVLVAIFHYLLDVSLPASFARVAFILLFLILIIGPGIKLLNYKPKPVILLIPHTWRGELGIWFTLLALAHVIILAIKRPIDSFITIGGGGYALANLMGLVALIIALMLAASSFNKVIIKLGMSSWQWLHRFAYVLFYLVTGHLLYFQFFSSYGKVGPDWFGYMAVVMAIVIILLQALAFIKVTIENNKPADPQK